MIRRRRAERPAGDAAREFVPEVIGGGLVPTVGAYERALHLGVRVRAPRAELDSLLDGYALALTVRGATW